MVAAAAAAAAGTTIAKIVAAAASVQSVVGPELQHLGDLVEHHINPSLVDGASKYPPSSEAC